MPEDANYKRMNYLEGMIWGLEFILGEVLRRHNPPLDREEIEKKAMDGWPASRRPDTKIGDGIKQAFSAVFPSRAPNTPLEVKCPHDGCGATFTIDSTPGEVVTTTCPRCCQPFSLADRRGRRGG